MTPKQAKFTYHGHHTVTYTKTPDGCTVTCDTCSLSRVAVNAIQFMVNNQVHSLVLDGAEIKRV